MPLQGGKSEVRVPGGGRSTDTITHNHPGSGYRNKTGMAARVGSSFSDLDLANIINGKWKGVRAVTKGYTFDVKRTPETKRARSSDVILFWKSEVRRQVLKNLNYIYSAKDHKERNIRIDRLNTVANHKATEATAKKYGLKYTRKKK